MGFVGSYVVRSQRRRGCVVCAVAESTGPAAVESATKVIDVAIVGGGPAGLSMASALGKRGVSVALVDKTLHRKWPNNYGVWMDEMEKVGLEDCMRKTWPVASVYMKDGNEKRVLDRAYGRIDVEKVKQRYLDRCAESGNVEIIAGSAEELKHGLQMSTLQVTGNEGDFTGELESRLVVDATGHGLRYVNFEEGHTPGVQTAYGMEIEVPSHPWPVGEMLLMDFRSEHMKESALDRQMAEETPLFFYVMPMSETRVFVEETSLIASPPLDFEYLKMQCYKRLAYHNVKVTEVLEEEFCYIPMGGKLPYRDQRVIGIGGAAGFVHPATGYMVANTLIVADSIADTIAGALSDKRMDGSAAAKRVWNSIWTEDRINQRRFLTFGGDLLEKFKLSELRGFFDGFFQLPKSIWAEFLSMGLIKPEERLVLGLGMFMKMNNYIRYRLILEAITKGQLDLARSVLPNPFRR